MRRLAALVVLLFAAGCGAASPAPSATASAAPSASAKPSAGANLTPAEAAALIRTTVTDAKPILVLNGVPDDWKAEVAARTNGFSVTYRSADGAKAVTLTLAAGNPPLPGAATTQSKPKFHGDADSLYQVTSGADARSERFLLWTDAGSWAGWPRSGVPYLLSGTGLTDAEFWDLANSLHPNQI